MGKGGGFWKRSGEYQISCHEKEELLRSWATCVTSYLSLGFFFPSLKSQFLCKFSRSHPHFLFILEKMELGAPNIPTGKGQFQNSWAAKYLAYPSILWLKKKKMVWKISISEKVWFWHYQKSQVLPCCKDWKFTACSKKKSYLCTGTAA